MVSLEEDGRVVIEVEVKERDVLCIPVALQRREGLLPQLEHEVSVEFEEDLGRSELSSLLYFFQNIIN